MKRYFDRTLLTKRVTVDYTGKDPRVSFEDPRDDVFIDKHLRIRFYLGVITLYVFLYLYSLIFFFIIGVIALWLLDTTLIFHIIARTYPVRNLLNLSLFFIPSFIIAGLSEAYYPDIVTLIPKILYFTEKHLLRSKEKRVMVKHLTEAKFEIPVFKNTFLQYEAEGEFVEFLERVEIKEHPFKILEKEGDILTRTIKRLFGYPIPEKEVPYIHLWRALFTFSAVPKTGKLDIRFM